MIPRNTRFLQLAELFFVQKSVGSAQDHFRTGFMHGPVAVHRNFEIFSFERPAGCDYGVPVDTLTV